MRTEGLCVQPCAHNRQGCAAATRLLNRPFNVTVPDTLWASEFTFVRMHEGWIYPVLVLDLFSRQVIRWAVRDRADTAVVLQALLPTVHAKAISLISPHVRLQRLADLRTGFYR